MRCLLPVLSSQVRPDAEWHVPGMRTQHQPCQRHEPLCWLTNPPLPPTVVCMVTNNAAAPAISAPHHVRRTLSTQHPLSIKTASSKTIKTRYRQQRGESPISGQRRVHKATLIKYKTLSSQLERFHLAPVVVYRESTKQYWISPERESPAHTNQSHAPLTSRLVLLTTTEKSYKNSKFWVDSHSKGKIQLS